MSVFVVVQGNLNKQNTDKLGEYRKVAGPVIAKHGGEVFARGKGAGKITGNRQWEIGIVIRFPDKAAVEAWHSDPEYQKVLPLRAQAYAELEITLFEE